MRDVGAARANVQDVATQQLAYASSVLAEMDARLAELARRFDPQARTAQER